MFYRGIDFYFRFLIKKKIALVHLTENAARENPALGTKVQPLCSTERHFPQNALWKLVA
jgi:hypothetical protein